MKRAFIKSERLNKIQFLLSSFENGLTRSEIAGKMGVSKSTVSRDITELSCDCPLTEDDKTGKLFLDKISLLTNLYLNAEEIQAMHLACRLLGRKVRFHYPSASSALRKLGTALEHYALPLASSITSTADLFETHPLSNNGGSAAKVKTITEGIITGRAISFERYSRREKIWKHITFSSYCIEPYAEGNSLYLVGCEKGGSETRTIKFELIRNIKLTENPYRIPESFNANDYFRQSWGIWTSAETAQRVVLVFSPSVKERVLQTEWHISEKTEELKDGGLVWRALIAEPLEMLPWIRGWGADVEVIEPERLRELIIEDIMACTAKYGLRMLSDNDEK